MNRRASTAATLRSGGLRLAFCCRRARASCGGSQFAYFDDGGGLTLSVVREQNYLGGPAIHAGRRRDAALPEAPSAGRHVRRRLSAQGVPAGAACLYSQSGQALVCRGTAHCEFQTYKTPPPFPGDAVGRFEARDQTLSFVPEKSAKR